MKLKEMQTVETSGDLLDPFSTQNRRTLGRIRSLRPSEGLLDTSLGTNRRILKSFTNHWKSSDTCRVHKEAFETLQEGLRALLRGELKVEVFKVLPEGSEDTPSWQTSRISKG